MKKFKEHKERARKFLMEDIWNVDFSELSKIKTNVIKTIKILFMTIRTFKAQKIGYQVVALSFFCTMAVVPFVAVAFAITGGLGLGESLKSLLQSSFSWSEEAINAVFEFANNMIGVAQSSYAGLISAIFFVWLVIWMMLSVESVFNNVWKVEKSRNIFKRMGFYCSILVISPFVMMLLFSGPIMLTNLFKFLGLDIHGLRAVMNILLWLLFYVVATFTFSAMYKFIPNCYVKYRYALRAALFSGLAFTLLQLIYVESQIFMARLGTVYGALAAIPFFMFWLNFAWFIIMFGAELSYSFQNVKNYSTEIETK